MLLLAQQGAFSHALTHLSGFSAPQSSQQDKHLPHSPVCDKCVVYAGMSGAATATPFAMPTLDVVTDLVSQDRFPFRSETPSHYRSRAPPSLA